MVAGKAKGGEGQRAASVRFNPHHSIFALTGKPARKPESAAGLDSQQAAPKWQGK